MMTPATLRAARALLNWSQKDLSRASGVHVNTINNFENGLSDVKMSTIIKLRVTFAKHGIEFIEPDGVSGSGLRFIHPIDG